MVADWFHTANIWVSICVRATGITQKISISAGSRVAMQSWRSNTTCAASGVPVISAISGPSRAARARSKRRAVAGSPHQITPPNEPGVLQVVGIDQASCIERDPTQICDFWLARPWQALRAPPKLWPVLPPLNGRPSHRLGRVGSAYFGGFLLVKLCQNHSPAACSKPSACSKSRGMGWGQTSFVVRSDAVRNRFI